MRIFGACSELGSRTTKLTVSAFSPLSTPTADMGADIEIRPWCCSLLPDCRLEYLGDLGGGPIVGAAGASQSRVERRHAAVVHHGHFRAMIDQILDHTRPGPLHRAVQRALPAPLMQIAATPPARGPALHVGDPRIHVGAGRPQDFKRRD